MQSFLAIFAKSNKKYTYRGVYGLVALFPSYEFLKIRKIDMFFFIFKSFLFIL